MSVRCNPLDPAKTRGNRPLLTVAKILVWADFFHEAHGRWPSALSGPVDAAPSENWGNINSALKYGYRGLAAGSSLPRLLDEHRPGRRKVLSVETILAWADTHHAATGQWPIHRTGPVADAPGGETWRDINLSLVRGLWGLPGGQSLAWLLEEHRQVKPRISKEGTQAQATMRRRLKAARPGGREPLSVEQILVWADRYHAATGLWPRERCGPVPGVPGETWHTVNKALMLGRCGLPGGSSLSRVLLEHRGPETADRLPDLTLEQVLAWADAYHAAHGRWPALSSGRVAESPKHTWRGIDLTLKLGARGLPGGSSLIRLLGEHRGRTPRTDLRELSVEQILSWADAHHAATKRWPTSDAGPVLGAPGETWNRINGALERGARGLPGGSSLGRLLDEHRQWGRLSLAQRTVLAWKTAPLVGTDPHSGTPDQ